MGVWMCVSVCVVADECEISVSKKKEQAYWKKEGWCSVRERKTRSDWLKKKKRERVEEQKKEKVKKGKKGTKGGGDGNFFSFTAKK